MKKGFIYLTLFLYLSTQLKPVAAIFHDFFEHTFFKEHHLATEHQENSQNHLLHELQELFEDKNNAANDKNAQTIKTFEFVTSHIVQYFNFTINPNETRVAFSNSIFQKTTKVYLLVSSPPPKA